MHGGEKNGRKRITIGTMRWIKFTRVLVRKNSLLMRIATECVFHVQSHERYEICSFVNMIYGPTLGGTQLQFWGRKHSGGNSTVQKVIYGCGKYNEVA
jgi:hypothetical protein